MSRCCSLAARSVRAPHSITSNTKPNSDTDTFLHVNVAKMRAKANDFFGAKKTVFAAQLGAVLATVDYPALAITGVNHEQELSVVVLDIRIISPIIMNWLRVRLYRRKFFEMYLQFMCVFMFFPGLLLWTPFLNYRKFPRDPIYEVSLVQTIKNGYLKYPFAKPEDYDY